MKPIESIIRRYIRILEIEQFVPLLEFMRRTGKTINIEQGIVDMENEIKDLSYALRLAQEILEVRKYHRGMLYG